MPSRLTKLLYVSDAVRPMSRAELDALVEPIRERNHRLGITGLLLYGNCHFMQVLEGDLTTVNSTLGRIQRDRRHRHVRLLFFQPIAKRMYGEWSMDLLNLDEQPALDRRSLRSLIEDAGLTPVDPEERRTDLAMELMEEFGRQLRVPQASGAGEQPSLFAA